MEEFGGAYSSSDPNEFHRLFQKRRNLLADAPLLLHFHDDLHLPAKDPSYDSVPLHPLRFLEEEKLLLFQP